MALSREAILGAHDLPKEEVDVPEWGGKVFIQAMNGEQRDSWDMSMTDGREKDGSPKINLRNYRARLVAYCAVDEKGARLFSQADLEALGRKSARALERCAKVAQKLSGLRDSDLEEAKGNSGAGLGAGSASTLQKN